MNFSISFLSLQKIQNLSPFFSPMKEKNFLLMNSKIKNSFSPFFFSNSAKLSIFKNVYFSKFLDTSIIISNMKEMHSLTHLTRINFENEDSIFIKSCIFSNCSSLNNRGGALEIHRGNATIIYSTFSNNSAKSSGSLELRDCFYINISQCSFEKSYATRFGVGMIDGHSEKDSSFLNDLNFTKNGAEKSVGVIRLQHGSGKLGSCNFYNNTAYFAGCVLTFTNRPSFRSFSSCNFFYNKANENSAALTIFLMGFFGQASHCIFVDNYDGSILVKSDSCSFDISDCTFSDSKDKEIQIRFSSCEVMIDRRTKFNITNV